MKQKDYAQRQREAAERLADIGELGSARAWLRRNLDRYADEAAGAMTPLEWAELEMISGPVGRFLRWLGFNV